MNKQVEKKRLFLSSTVYDQLDLRAELKTFLKEEVKKYKCRLVAFEDLKTIDIGGKKHSHDVCLDAVAKSDLYLLIISNRYGGIYAGSKYLNFKNISITHAETRLAIQKELNFLSCVRKSVYDEWATYKKNIELGSNIIPFHAQDEKIFHLLDEIQHLPANNWIIQFTDVVDLKRQLKDALTSFCGFDEKKVKMISKSSESESWHHIRNAIITLINLIPFVGGALGKLADEYLPNPKQDQFNKRLESLEKISRTNYETKSIKEIYGLLPPFANAKMFGRDDKFNRIKEILEFEKNHVFIYGEHGIGKTMLAAKLCKVFEKPCLWYSVRTEDITLSKVYGDILQLLEVEDFPNENQVENKIKECIIDNQITAIFLDNIDSIEIIKKFLSFCNTIEKPLIVTSHCTNINGEFERNNKFKLEVFGDKNIAKELFKVHLPEIELKDDDEEIIDIICENLDYHPFDIKIVAPQMEFYPSLSDLKEALLDEENAISILKDVNDSNPYLSHYKSLNLTYNNLNEDNQKLFTIIASFPSKSVSKSLINYFSELNLNFLQNLIRFSIINIDKENKKYEVHHLTHLFIIEKLKEMEEAKKENNFTNKKVKNMIIKFLMNYIDDNSDWDNLSHRENIRKEKDNILGAMKWCHLSKDVNNLIEFENIMRHYLYVFGEWDERIKWSQKVWDLRNNKYLMDKKGYKILMAGVEGLCFVYLQRGEVEEVNNILDIAQKHLPLNTENREWQRVWCFYHRVKGMLNYNKDLFEEAKNNFKTSIEFAKKSDWETMEIPIGIQLGMPYFEQKKYNEAINVLNSCINHAYEHYEHKPKESPPYRRIIRASIWLGKCYCEIGSFEESREKFKNSEELYSDVGGLSEPLLINDLYFEWGLLEKKSKNYKIARKLITSINEDVRYYWSAKKLDKLYKIKEELEINQ